MPKKIVNPKPSPFRKGITKSNNRVAKRKTPKKRVAPRRTCRKARPRNRVTDSDIELSEEPSVVCISEDSDDDYSILEDTDLLTRTRTLNTASDNCIPSTSNAASCENTASPVIPVLNASLERDLMEYVDNFLEETNTQKAEPKVDDMKSLEEYREETEEILKSVSALLDECTAPRKPPETVTTAADKNEDKVIKIKSCPICFESFVGRLASVTICGHIFCTQCITQAAQTLKKCPSCRENINAKKIHPVYF